MSPNLLEKDIETTTTTSVESFQTPQQLFSLFQIPPDIHQQQITNNIQQLQSIKPNILQKQALDDMQSTKVIQTAAQGPTPGKPLLVQGPASHPQHFYLMNQPNNGFFGYHQPSPIPTNIPPQNMYRLSPSPFLDSRYIYSQPPQATHATMLKKDPVTPLQQQQNEVKVLDPTLHSSAILRQSCATIQGQMAANQIPLCLVQDSQGQLHQLVYTVPEDLYEKYVAAAKKGFKVKVQPHIESLKNALSNAIPTTATSTAASTLTTRKEEENDEESKICDEDLKLVKELKPRGESSLSSNRTTQSYKTNNNNNNIPTTTLIKTDGDLKHVVLNQQQLEQPTHSISVPKQMRQVELPPQTPTISSAQKLYDNPLTQRPTTMSSTTSSNDILSLIKNSACEQSSNDVIREVINSTKKFDHITNRTGIDLGTSLTTSPGIPRSSQPPISPITTKTTTTTSQTNIQTSAITQKTTKEEKVHSEMETDANLERAMLLDTSESTKTTTTTTTNDNKQSLLSFLDDDGDDEQHVMTSSTQKQSSESNNELVHNINTIDSILAKNEDALIPKSDVEALLRCLKRKLGRNNDDGCDVTKRQKVMSSSDQRNIPSVPSFTKCNSFDYETLDLLSPESLPEAAESPCNSVFSNNELGSVSSLEISSDSIIPSVSSSIENDIFDTSRLEFHNSPNVVLSENNKTQNTNTHVGFDLFDNLRDDLFTTGDLGYQDILPTASIKHVSNPQEKLRTNSTYSTDHFSLPSGQQNYEMDLFDHLWGELDGI